ncbi:MAG: succinate dehydrogenase [Thermoproteus sp.]|nr:succinate dehydrogenase [Thermoproteus sp.]
MRESTDRLILFVDAFIMIVGIPLVVAAAIALGKIPLDRALNTNPIVIIPYAFVKIGWGAIWAIVALDWVMHGALGIRRILMEFVRTKQAQRLLEILIWTILIITGIITVYVLVFIP